MRRVAFSFVVLCALLLSSACCEAKNLNTHTGSSIFERASPRLDVSLDGRRTTIYLFNITNPLDFLNGAKPNLQEVGPFVYDRNRTLQDVSYPRPGVTQFFESNTYTFNAALSTSPDFSTNITTLNTPFLFAAQFYGYRQQYRSLYELFTKFSYYSNADDAKRLFINRSVRDIVFGWQDCVLNLLDVAPISLLQNGTSSCTNYGNRFQQISGINNQQIMWQGESNITTCFIPASTSAPQLPQLRDPISPGCQCSMEYDVPAWGSNEAIELQGGDGIRFITPLTSPSTGIFSPDLSRFVQLEIASTAGNRVELNIPAAVWANSSVEPGNSAYFQFKTPQGLLNQTSVSRAPLYVSQPRFEGADPILLDAISATFLPTPSAADLTSVWTVDNVTGNTSYSRFAIQENIFLQPISASSGGVGPGNWSFNWFPKMVPIYFPVAWTSEEYRTADPTGSCFFTVPDGNSYNLSSLTTPTGTLVIGPSDSSVFSINFCGYAEGDGAQGICAKSKAAVCIKYDWSPDWFALAEISDGFPQWSEYNSSGKTGVVLTYSNGNFGSHEVNVTIQVICSNESTAYNVVSEAPYNWLIVVESEAGCPIVPPAPLMVCNYTFEDGNMFDLSSLTTPNGTIVSVLGLEYSINVCGIAAGDGLQGVCRSQNATVCAQQSDDTWTAIAALNSSQPTWELIDPNNPNAGVQWTFVDGSYEGTVPMTIFLFYCTDSAEPSYSIESVQPPYTFVVTIKSSAACPRSNSTTVTVADQDNSIAGLISEQ